MNNAEKNTGKKKHPPPRSKHILTPAFVATEGAELAVEVHRGRFRRDCLRDCTGPGRAIPQLALNKASLSLSCS